MTTATKPGIRGWMVVIMLCFVGVLNYLDRIMITTMRSSITEAIPMTDAEFGLLTSVFLWVYGLLSPFAGYLADRFNRSRVIIISLFVWSVITWLTSYANSFETLLATRALMGISEACYIPAALALIADYHRSSSRSLATGIHMAGIMAGQSLGFIGGWIAEDHTWTHAFSIFGVIGILYAFILFFALKDPPYKKDLHKVQKDKSVGFLKGIKKLFTLRSFNLMIAFWGVISMVTWALVGWLPTYYKEHFDLSQSIAGLYATGYLYPASIAGLLLGGFLADRYSRSNNKARIVVTVVGLCIAAPSVFIAASTDIIALAVVCFILYIITKSFSDTNTMPILCLVVDPGYRATAYGILNLFGCLLGGIGLYLSGWLHDRHVHLGQIYQVGAFLLLGGAILLFMVRPRFKEA